MQFVFEVETGPKPSCPMNPVGVDSGVKVLAARSDGKRFGELVWELLERIKRCAHGPKGQRRARRALRQYMDECAKDLVKDVDGVVVEKLRRLNDKTNVRRRLTRNMRRVLGGWAYRYWLGRLRMTCDQNRVLFRSVPPSTPVSSARPAATPSRGTASQGIASCVGDVARADNADINAARVILRRFLTGAYGPGCTAEVIKIYDGGNGRSRGDGIRLRSGRRRCAFSPDERSAQRLAQRNRNCWRATSLCTSRVHGHAEPTM